MQPAQDENFWQPVADPSATPEPLETAPETPSEPAADMDQPLTWQASEYVHHEKGGGWFLVLMAVAVVLLLLDIFLVNSWTFAVLIVVMALAVAIVARRPPRTLTYTLSLQGIRINDKSFSFHDFRAFGVIQEGAFYSIRLIPSKRFMPLVSVFFPPEHGERIVDVFGSMLPMEPVELDTIDKIVEKIRF